MRAWLDLPPKRRKRPANGRSAFDGACIALFFRPTSRLAAADANGRGRRCGYQRTQAKLFKLKNMPLARSMLYRLTFPLRCKSSGMSLNSEPPGIRDLLFG